MKHDLHGYDAEPMILEHEREEHLPSALDAARQTAHEVAERLHAMQHEPAVTSSAVVTLGHEVATLRDEMTSLAADARLAPELERQLAELAAQCTDLPSLRAAVTRLEQDLETRLQAPAPRLERVVCELQADVARTADIAGRALGEVRALSAAAAALEARLGAFEQRLTAAIDERRRSPLAALRDALMATADGVRTRFFDVVFG
jgi:chromosome segregation ATPase